MTHCGKPLTSMTLIELLATLAVLTALAGVAIVGLGDLAGRTRQTSTNDIGTMVRKDVVGSGGNYSAFLSDMGRLPVVLSNGAGKGLAELFDATTVPAAIKYDSTLKFTNTTWDSLADFSGTYTDPVNMDVAFPCGWRGPYFVAASDELYDGWGNDWQVNIGTNDTPTWSDSTDAGALNKLFCGIRSTGRDGTEDSGTVSWEDEDKVFTFDDNLTTADLTVELYIKDSGSYIAVPTPPALIADTLINRQEVALYSPYVTDSAIAIKRVLASNIEGVVANSILPAEDADFPHTENSDWDAYNTVHFTGLKPGLHRLYAFGYKWDSATSTASNGVTSGIQLIELKPGGNVLKVYLSSTLN